MSISRRRVLALGAVSAPALFQTPAVANASSAATPPAFTPRSVESIGDRVDPWIELDRGRYHHNARAISKSAGDRPVIAVLKNNAYGLGVVEVAWILRNAPTIWGFGVVHAADALALRNAGISKPILLMARHATDEAEDLARAGVTLSVFAEDDPERMRNLAKRLGKPAAVHLYVDTGLGRMGRLHDQMAPWIVELAESVRVEGALTMLTSDENFATEQIRRFQSVRAALAQHGVKPSMFHVASSYPMLHWKQSLFDAVRPGILLHGSLPSGGEEEAALVDVRVAFRVRARIVRLERLPAGSTLGFSRFYPIDKPTWIATVPTGWGDGYPSAAENGAVVLVGNRTLPVVNVNSNHTNVLIGEEKTVEIGDAVTLLGFGHSALTPEGQAKLIGGHNYRQIDLKGYLPKYIA